MEDYAVRVSSFLKRFLYMPFDGLAGAVSLALVFATNAWALERPSAAELDQLRQDPVAFAARQQKAQAYGNHKIDPRLVQRAAQKLSLLSSGRGEAIRELPPPEWRAMPTTGTNQVLFFLIDFPDYPHVNSYDTITNKLFGAGLPAEFPLESLTKFYERSSYGLLKIEGATLGWYRMAHNRSWYTDTYGDGNEANYQIIKEVAEHFNGSIDYSQFDNNNDGNIDYFAVLWAGPDNGWANFWWGYQWELYSANLTLDGVRFFSFSWQWESRPVGSAYMADVVIHETGHALGLPDYYDYDGSVGPDGGVGGMDMMDANYCDHNCFSKFILDWLTPTVVLTGTNQMPKLNSAEYPEAVALANGYAGTPFEEYFMVQNRQQVGNDQNLPGSGLVVWHLDARLNGAGTDYQYNNSYTAHKLLKLMEADGLHEIESNGSADAGDFYVAGKEFTPASNPDSDFYDGTKSEVRVTNISASNRVVTADYSAVDNVPVADPARIYVLENGTTNVSVSLFREPSTDVVVTVSVASGSPNLYVVGTPALTFTTANWSNAQVFTVGSYNDADMTNDLAVIRLAASGGGVQSANVVAEQMDTGDNLPPQCAFSGSVNADRTEVYLDFRFDEKVAGFAAGDLVLASNIAGGHSLLSLVDVDGSNRHYLATVSVASSLGAVTVTVPAGSLNDMSGNANPNLEYQFAYTLPWVNADFRDDMEAGVNGWTASTQVLAGLTMRAWAWGTPDYVLGPASAYSGSNCWGTVLNGDYPDYMNAWLMSQPIPVGANPVLEFYVWYDLEYMYDLGYVEVFDGTSWKNVTPSGYYTDVSGGWVRQQIALDNATFGNRFLTIRFKATSNYSFTRAGMYVDDVTVRSERGPGLWLTSSTPAAGTAGTSVPMTFSVYNSYSATVRASALVSSPDPGVAVVSGCPIDYGTLVPGAVATSAVPVTVQLGAVSNFVGPVVSLLHQSFTGSVAGVSDRVPLVVEGVAAPVLTNSLLVQTLTGVTNWLGSYLRGDGSERSCIFQVVFAGTNAVPDAPRAGGQPGGDDRLLYTSRELRSLGWFGEGGVPADAGRFLKLFAHNLGPGAKVFVRAWDGSSFDGSAAYGDSVLYTLGSASAQTNNFGTWKVGQPAPGSFSRDSNGDSIPDGWCVLSGMDPRQALLPLGARVVSAKAATGFSFPNRVAVSTQFVFVADTENSRIQVWDRALSNRLYMLGGVTDTNFSRPRGLAVSRDGSRLAVADTAHRRVRVFSVTAGTGALVPLFNFGAFGTGDGQFNDPIAVAFGASGEIIVADSQQSGIHNDRVQIFNAAGVFMQAYGAAGPNPGEFNLLLGVGMGSDGTLYAADGTNNRVQAFAGGTSYAWSFGSAGTGPGQFNRVWDAQPGAGAMLYVADLYNKRIQVLNTVTRSVVGIYSNAGPALGAFNMPQSAAPAPDDSVLYVADTYNSRVLRLKTTVDSDGDGMDDVWESLHGLDPADPSDALSDPDGDGVYNIGEYRVGSNPQNPNSDGDGAGDMWELVNGLDPAVSNAVPAGIPVLLSLAVSPTSPVRPGQTVVVTATYSAIITNAPALALTGALGLGPVVMTGAGASWSSAVPVPGTASGTVNGVVSGAIGGNGLLADPPSVTSNALFTIAGPELRITALEMPARLLAWPALSGDIYRVQSRTNLMLGNWVDGIAVTSKVNSLVTVTNAFPAVERVQFMRVLRLWP